MKGSISMVSVLLLLIESWVIVMLESNYLQKSEALISSCPLRPTGSYQERRTRSVE